MAKLWILTYNNKNDMCFLSDNNILQIKKKRRVVALLFLSQLNSLLIPSHSLSLFFGWIYPTDKCSHLPRLPFSLKGGDPAAPSDTATLL